MGGEHVDTAAVVHAICIGFPPCALRNIHHAGQDARRDSGRDDQLAALIPDADKVAIVDVSCGGVYRVDENSLRESLLQPVVVVVRGVDSRKGVMSDGLQRINVVARALLYFAEAISCCAFGDCFVGLAPSSQ